MIEIHAICIVHTLTGTHTFVQGFFLQKLAQRRAMYKFIASLSNVYGYGSSNICVYNLFRTLHQEIHATRHNITIHHNNGGEIVPLVEYLVGRNSGRYQASHPFWYRRSEKRIHKFGRAIVADSMGNTFRHGGLQRQATTRYQHQSLEEQERYHRQEQEQSLSPSIPPSPAAIQDQPPCLTISN